MPRLGFGVYQNYTTTESVREALRVGYRLAYRNEAHVGAAWKGSDLPREEVFLTTKCINKTHGYESTLKGVDVSLERFGVEYIDLFLIHDPMSGRDRRLQTYKALQDARRAGKIRSIGVSNYGVHHLEEIRAAGYTMPSVNQIEVCHLHPFCQQKAIVSYCSAHSIVVQAYCPILRGKMDHPVILELAERYHKEAAQILLRWSLQKGFVPLPKSATPERIRSNIQLYDFSLDDDAMTRLNALDKGKEGALSWNPVDHP
ncbi:hypothetical protein IEO21_05039 [Rhodonia placenta]|uniref:NADP-dependent oxidoreductase domain-containing protein n=1 Tax=Rhodonia placenta TaxID=104341 RepID=A0A8H7P368_9APHY|nr:hypothetical protein IEO21_05039 [Postia placenta]